MREKTRVLIADDHQIVREGLRLILSVDPEVSIVGEAASGDEAVAKAGELAPHVVLMSVSVSGIGGVEATRRVRSLYPSTGVVLLTNDAAEAGVGEAMVAGADGYLLREIAPPELIRQTVHAVRQGLAGSDRRSPERLVDQQSNQSGEEAAQGGRRDRSLTPRERDILGLIVEGKANKEIAYELSIAEDTVKKHVQSIISKLGVADRTQAAVKALRIGLVA